MPVADTENIFWKFDRVLWPGTSLSRSPITVVGVAGQVLQVLCSFATGNFGLLRQDDAELAQQTTYTVEGRGAGGNKALTSAVHHQARLLVNGLHWNEAHVGSLHGFANGGGVGRVVLAALAAHSVRRHELGRHQLDGVAVGSEQASPVMGTRATNRSTRSRTSGSIHCTKTSSQCSAVRRLERVYRMLTHTRRPIGPSP